MRVFSMVCVAFLLAPVVSAQSADEVVVGLEAPTLTGESGLFETITADTIGRGEWTLGLYHDVSVFEAGSELLFSIENPPVRGRPYEDMIVDQARSSASIGFGITDRWEMSLSLPYIDLEGRAGDRSGFVNGFQYNGAFTESGTGHLRLATKFALSAPDATNRWAIHGFFGKEMEDDPSGISIDDQFGASIAFTRGVFSTSLGYVVNDGSTIAEDAIGEFVYRASDLVRADFGISLPLAAWQGANWITEINTNWYTGGSVDDPEPSISVTTGLRKAFGASGWGLSAAVRNNVTAAIASEDTKGFGFIVGIHHGPVQVVSIAPPPVIPMPPVAVPIPEPCPEPVEPAPIATPAEPESLLQQKIDFDASSARTTNIAKAMLDDVALRMRQEPTSTLIVTGYATAAELRSQSKLDLRRAEAVRDFLTSRHKVAESRISVQAGGEGDKKIDLKLVVP